MTEIMKDIPEGYAEIGLPEGQSGIPEGYIEIGYGHRAEEEVPEDDGRTVGGTLKDIAATVAKGVVGLGGVAVGLADIPTLGRVGRGMEKYLGYDLAATQEFLGDFYSSAQKAAFEEVEKAKGFIPTAKAMVKHPSTIGHAVIESAPQMLGGAAAARKLVASGLLKMTPVWNNIIAAAMGEGLVSAGGTAEGIRQQTEDGVLTPKQAAIPVISGAGTALFAVVGGRIAKKFGIIDPDTFLAGGSNVTSKGVIKRIIGGGISEGAFEELPQSMQEQVWLNAALDKPLLEGVGEAGATGLLTGAAMGAGFNIFTGKPYTEAEKETTVFPDEINQEGYSEVEEESLQGMPEGYEEVKQPEVTEKIKQPFVSPIKEVKPEPTIREVLAERFGNKEIAEITSNELQRRINTAVQKKGKALTDEEILQEKVNILKTIQPTNADLSAQVFEEIWSGERPMPESMKQEILTRKFQPSPKEIQAGKEGLLAKTQEIKDQRIQKRILSDGTYGTKDGNVFKSKGSANLNKSRVVKETGLDLEAVEIKGGWGLKELRAEPAIETEPITAEETSPAEDKIESGKEPIKYIGTRTRQGKEVPIFEATTGRDKGYQIDYDFEKHEITNLAEYEKVVAAKPLPSTPTEAKPLEAAEDEIEGEGIVGVGPKEPIKAKPSKVRTLRGAIKAKGGINFLNYSGELKDLDPATKKEIARKGGLGIDQAVDEFIAEGWLDKNTTVASVLEDLRTNPEKLLSRDKIVSDITTKKPHELSAEEKRLKEELEYEPEAPSEGEYVTLNAEDLPAGKKMTLIEGKTGEWDTYEIKEKDEFSVTLKDGKEITLSPFDKVQVLKKDVKKTEDIEIISPDGTYVNREKIKTAEKDGLKATYYGTYRKDGAFKAWKTTTEIDRIKKAEGKVGLDLKQEYYGKQAKVEPVDKMKQRGLGLEVEDKTQPGLFEPVGGYGLEERTEKYVPITRKEADALSDKGAADLVARFNIRGAAEATGEEGYYMRLPIQEKLKGYDKKTYPKYSEEVINAYLKYRKRYGGTESAVSITRGETKQRDGRLPAEVRDEKKFATKATKPQETITRKDLKEIFAKMKHVTTGVDKDGNFFFKPFGKPTVSILEVDEVGGYVNTSLGQMPVGSYLKNKIELKTGGKGHTADTTTVWHEFVHWMEANGILSTNDIKALDAAIDKTTATEEDRATYVGDRLANWPAEPNSRIKRILKKISDFMDTVWELVSKTRTAEGVLRDIKSGKLLAGKKETVERAGALVPAYQMAGKKAMGAPTEAKKFQTKPTIDYEDIIPDDIGTPELLKAIDAKRIKSFPVLEKSSDQPGWIKEKFGRTEKTITEKIGDNVGAFRKNWRTRLLDRLHPIKALGETAYMLHRLETGAQATMSMFMRHGKLRWEGKALTTDTQKQGFMPWLDSLGNDAQKLFYWMAAKRAEVLETEGREKWLDADTRKKIFDWVGDKPESAKSWKALNSQFQEFNKSVLDLAQQAGLINPINRAAWEQEFYVPFYRIFEDGIAREEFLKGPLMSKKHISAQIKRLTGAEMKIGDPLENIIRNWSHLIHESVRNMSRAEAYNYAQKNNMKAGMANDSGELLPLIETMKASDLNIYRSDKEKRIVYVTKKGDDNVLSFQKNGRKVYFKVNDAELFNALSDVNHRQFNGFLIRAFGQAKRWLTYGATFGPAFKVANMLRDTLHTAIISKSFVPFIDSGKGIVKALREDQDYVEFMASGAGFGSSYIRAENPKALAEYINRIVKKEGKGSAQRILDTPKKILDFWEKLGAASENAARVQLYTKRIAEGETHLKAAFEGRDLMDFTMRGDSQVVQFLIRTIPFMNARAQGLYKLGRAAKQDPKAFIIKGSMLTMATLALWAINRDNDEWKELEDWDKRTYYHFWIGDKHYRMPKPFETGAIFSTMFEGMAETMSGDEEFGYFVDVMKDTFLDTFAMNPIPQAIRPLLEQWSNKSFFTGRPIEGQSLQRLQPGERKTAWTSETMQLAGKLGVSPKRAEEIIRGYFATFGMFLLGTSDIFAYHLADFPTSPTKEINDYPLLGRFIKEKAPARHTKYQTKFYEMFREVDQLVATINNHKRLGNYKEATVLAKKERKNLKKRKGLLKVRTQLTEINAMLRQTMASKILTADQKRTKIDKLVERKNQATKQIYERYVTQ